MANHLHQPVISMGAGAHTFSSNLTWTEVWVEAPAAGGKGVWERNPSAWRIWGIYYHNIRSK